MHFMLIKDGLFGDRGPQSGDIGDVVTKVETGLLMDNFSLPWYRVRFNGDPDIYVCYGRYIREVPDNVCNKSTVIRIHPDGYKPKQVLPLYSEPRGAPIGTGMWGNIVRWFKRGLTGTN